MPRHADQRTPSTDEIIVPKKFLEELIASRAVVLSDYLSSPPPTGYEPEILNAAHDAIVEKFNTLQTWYERVLE